MQNQYSLNKKESSDENEIDRNLSNNNVKTEIEPPTYQHKEIM